jgi:hypothetical protein
MEPTSQFAFSQSGAPSLKFRPKISIVSDIKAGKERNAMAFCLSLSN